MLAAEISSKTVEQRFDKFSNQLVKSAKHIYTEKATYHELTEDMRAWVLKKSDIKKAFHLNRTCLNSSATVGSDNSFNFINF